MIYLIYALLVPCEVLLSLVALIISPILPLFASQNMGYVNNSSAQGIGLRLPNWLGWFQTWDNSLYGDDTFQSINGKSYLSAVKWLVRNPLPCFAMKIITDSSAIITGNNNITDGSQGIAGKVLVKIQGLFQFVWIWAIPLTTKCIYVNLGWNIRALTMGTKAPFNATFSFSPRISNLK